MWWVERLIIAYFGHVLPTVCAVKNTALFFINETRIIKRETQKIVFIFG